MPGVTGAAAKRTGLALFKQGAFIGKTLDAGFERILLFNKTKLVGQTLKQFFAFSDASGLLDTQLYERGLFVSIL